MSKEALRIALEALEYWDVHGKLHQPTEEAITAIKQALAAPVQPVAYWIPKAEQFCIASPSGRPFAKAWEPLYTTPHAAPAQEFVCSTGLCHYRKPQQEPVAWMDASGDIYKNELWPDWNPPHTPLYATPPAQTAPVQEFKKCGLCGEDQPFTGTCGGGRENPKALCFIPPEAPDLQAELDATNRQVEILSNALAESRREVAALKTVQEPVAWFYRDNLGRPCSTTKKPLNPFKDMQPLYTTPPAAQRPWVGLSDEQFRYFASTPDYGTGGLIRAIEAELKGNNT